MKAAAMNFPESRSICYVAVEQEVEGVDQSSSLARRRAFGGRFAAGGALAVMLAAALTLAGCGRRGGLDAPPMAAAGDAQSPSPSQAAGQQPPPPGATGATASPAVDKRKTIFDWLIN